MITATQNLAKDAKINVNIDWYEYTRLRERDDRRLYLYGYISDVDCDDKMLYYDASMMAKLTEYIMEYNRLDDGIAPEKRKPIRLYIHSPGGDVTEGFALIGAMKTSKTPVYTINVGECCSMAFLIGITGTKRFSLPSATFMMHEPSGLTIGKFSDMADKVIFNKKYACKIIKKHILKHSKMSPAKYGSVSKKDFYMLAEEALKYGFIDRITSNISAIL
ncbi:ATP-dependent Clp protease proteolytic subunit [Candidatus Saccharibacteria bacterium]|nr:ATP-dependent Clp protease proteolytic subunit [Candidatus Saccharibacteria bacterium]